MTGVFARLLDRLGSRRGIRSVPHRRLALVDAARIDQRRHLILVRRDNVEHLLMIGGPTDIVIEPNVVRAAEREPAVAQPGAFAEATPRSVVAANEGTWPPQLDTAPIGSTSPRPQRQSRSAEQPVPRNAEAGSTVSSAPREPRPVNRSTVQATEASDQHAPAQEPRGPRERRETELLAPQPPQNAPGEAALTTAVDPDCVDAAQALVEAALRRHRKPGADAQGDARSQV
jgi:flagellar protein FliO/FliZ